MIETSLRFSEQSTAPWIGAKEEPSFGLDTTRAHRLNPDRGELVTYVNVPRMRGRGPRFFRSFISIQATLNSMAEGEDITRQLLGYL